MFSMMSLHNENGPCDGKIPKDWNLPELSDLIKITSNCVQIDLRHQSAPTPLVATLKILDRLSPGQYFEGYYPKMPMHLFSHLQEKAWVWDVVEQNDQGIRLRIYREGQKP